MMPRDMKTQELCVSGADFGLNENHSDDRHNLFSEKGIGSTC